MFRIENGATGKSKAVPWREWVRDEDWEQLAEARVSMRTGEARVDFNKEDRVAPMRLFVSLSLFSLFS